ncbi:Uncharacterised protein [Acinetobacter baumannii]|nr:Uncharacterised protein [Acinetobacter baumannii]
MSETHIGGKGASLNISRMPALASSAWRACRLSPWSTAIFSCTPAFSQAAARAAAQACGLIPPALLMTRIFFSAISPSSGARTSTKSVA